LVGDDAIESEDGTLYSLTPTEEWTRVDDDDNNGRTINPIEWTGGDEEFSANIIDAYNGIHNGVKLNTVFVLAVRSLHSVLYFNLNATS
jgi:hypothetical protein